MDLEHLNKTQIVLLTLLVSFVTSIATGIATVSLMEKAPTDVTRVISRIVEKPIETIIPGGREVVTQEPTVIVSESALIANAVQTITPSLVRLYSVSRRDERTFIGIGVIVSAEGIVVSDRRMVDNSSDYIARLSDGTEVIAEASQTDTEQGFFRLSAMSGQTLPTLTPASFVPFDTLVLGETVISIGGENSTRISPGVIAELLPSLSEDSSSRLRATVDASGLSLGSPLLNLKGQIIGMPEEAGSQTFLSLLETGGE